MDNDGKFIFDPKFEEEQSAKINVVVAGTNDAITMVESGAKEVSQDDFLKILEYSHSLIKELCNAQNDFIVEAKNIYGIHPIVEKYNLPDETLYSKVEEFLTVEKLECLYNLGKKEFEKMLTQLDEEVTQYFIENKIVEIEEGKTLEEAKKDL